MKKAIFFGILVLVLLGTVFFMQNNVIARDPADIGRCLGDCASEQGICISQCYGNAQCISNCAAAYSRCVARCN